MSITNNYNLGQDAALEKLAISKETLFKAMSNRVSKLMNTTHPDVINAGEQVYKSAKGKMFNNPTYAEGMQLAYPKLTNVDRMAQNQALKFIQNNYGHR